MIQVYIEACADPVPGSRRLLELALRERGGEIPPLRHQESGQPWLEGGPMVSLSHTRGAAAVALGDTPVGVDVEFDRTVRRSVIRRTLSDPELKWYESRGEKTEDFLVLWTLKESYYKYLGTGLPGFPNQTEFFENNGIWQLRDAPQRFFVWKKDRLTAALCCDEQEVFIHWRP